jgi:NADH pyrophosphatase NudC (nudix superfamily)
MPEYRYCPQCASPLAEEERGGSLRRVCAAEGCGFVHWNNPAPVVAAIVERDDHIILVRSHGWPEGWYGLVTGFLEHGEMPEEAVLREVEEETGLEAELAGYVGMYPFYRMNQLLIVYHVLAGPGDIRLDETELSDWREVPVEKVRPWPQGTGVALRKWLAARGYERDYIPLPGRESEHGGGS